jgi:CubicO group peptidase (beta-lactamase class C family)
MNSKRVKKVIKVVFILASFASLAIVPWSIVKAWLVPLPDSVEEQVSDALENGFDGVVVYVNKAGETPQKYAAGWHNKEKKIPANPDALFKIASISKLYVAVAITKLVKAEVLHLDSSLAYYFPELIGGIDNAETITIRTMVQHRSGIPNYTSIPNYWANPKETHQGNLELVLGMPARFKPGTDYEYSNTNYLLLATLMDKVLGYNHFQFIQSDILNPLHLKNTFASLQGVEIENVMSGYHVGHPFDLKTDKVGMLATAEDVGLFIRALNDGSVFLPGEKEIYSSIYEYQHTGLVPGYQSIASYHKELDAVVVQFTSPTNFEGYNWNIAEVVHNRIVKIIGK